MFVRSSSPSSNSSLLAHCTSVFRFRFDTLEEVHDIQTQDETLKNAYARLAGALLDEDFVIVRVVARVAKPSSCGSLVSAVRILFESNKLIYSLLESLVKDHVEECADQTTLFRKNNLTSALITQFCVHHGKSFLQGMCAVVRAFVSDAALEPA
jgi:hypothetical protein